MKLSRDNPFTDEGTLGTSRNPNSSRRHASKKPDKPFKVIHCRGPELAADLLKRAVVIRRITAGDFMTQQPLCLNQDSNLSVATKLMTTHRISGIPVADESGKLAGIISRRDMTQTMAHRKALDQNDIVKTHQ